MAACWGSALIAFLLAWQAMHTRDDAPVEPARPSVCSPRRRSGSRDLEPGVAAFLGGDALVWSASGALASAFDLGVEHVQSDSIRLA